MSPDDAQQMQIEAYRRMTGDERLRIGLELSDLACEVARCGIRSQRPEFTTEQIVEELRRRVRLSWQ